jgi:hypothetical protein
MTFINFQIDRRLRFGDNNSSTSAGQVGTPAEIPNSNILDTRVAPAGPMPQRQAGPGSNSGPFGVTVVWPSTLVTTLQVQIPWYLVADLPKDGPAYTAIKNALLQLVIKDELISTATASSDGTTTLSALVPLNGDPQNPVSVVARVLHGQVESCVLSDPATGRELHRAPPLPQIATAPVLGQLRLAAQFTCKGVAGRFLKTLRTGNERGRATAQRVLNTLNAIGSTPPGRIQMTEVDAALRAWKIDVPAQEGNQVGREFTARIEFADATLRHAVAIREYKP